jgi:hypothetical protein
MLGRARTLLSSPRRRRRLIALLVVLITAVVVTLLIAYDRNSAKSTATPMTKGNPTVPKPQPKSHRFTRAEADRVLPVAQRFIREVVDRQNMHAGWSITAPALRSDTSRADWDRGNNTEIAPFPVDHARWQVDYNYRDAVGLEIAVFPRKNSTIKNPMVYYLEAVKSSPGGQTRWLVDQWIPAPGSAQVVQGGSNPIAANRSTPPPPGLSSLWLLAPLGILAGIVAIPLTVVGREWRRNRRARRKYEAGLPPLPRPPI